jgi:lipopolysaccharide biosynthesis regulator YciM
MDKFNRIEALLEMLQTEPGDIFLNYSLAIEYAAAGTLDLAEDQFLKVLDFKEDYVPAYYQLGKLYEQKQDMEKALDYYNKGLGFAKAQKNTKAVNEFGEAIFMLE